MHADKRGKITKNEGTRRERERQRLKLKGGRMKQHKNVEKWGTCFAIIKLFRSANKFLTKISAGKTVANLTKPTQ
jgi:hypothetical protein